MPKPSSQAKPPGTSLGSILRQRWWIIALTVIAAVAVATVAALTAAPTYRTSLRLQTLALDDVDVTLFTRRSAGDAGAQMSLTQEAFNNLVQSPLVAWRTIDDLRLDLDPSELLDNLEVTASGEFVTVAYKGSTAQEALDVVTRQVENALANLNNIQARPSIAAGQFVEAQLAEQGKTLMAAQDALLKFQLEHTVGDVGREINAMQDIVRGLQEERDATEIEASRAEVLAEQYASFAAAAEKALEEATQKLAEARAAVQDEATPAQQEEIDALTDQVTVLQAEVRDNRNAQRAQTAAVAALRAAIAESEALAGRRAADLTQLISLSGQYNTLQTTLRTAQDDYDLLRAKAAEARLKQNQISTMGTMQVIEPAFLPAAPAGSSVVRVVLMAALAALLLGIVFVVVLELIKPSAAAS
jgi:uncharacterized protein involved in exopolysaccharide biosynthesis